MKTVFWNKRTLTVRRKNAHQLQKFLCFRNYAVCFLCCHKVIRKNCYFIDPRKEQDDWLMGSELKETMKGMGIFTPLGSGKWLGCQLGQCFHIHPMTTPVVGSGLLLLEQKMMATCSPRSGSSPGDVWVILAFAMDREERMSEIFWLVSASWSLEISKSVSSQESK